MPNRKEKIAEVATNSIKRDGYRNLSFRHLAEEIGVKSSSVHYHFPAKSDLALALVEEYTDQFSKRLSAIRASNKSLYGQLDALVTVFQKVLEEGQLCLCGMMAAELTSLDKDTRQALWSFFDSMESWVLDTIRQDPEALHLPLQPEQFARILVSGLEGAMLLDRVEEGTDRLSAQRALLKAVIH